MADLTDTDAVVESITAGDHDGRLVDLIEAVRLRFTFGTSRQKWRLTYPYDDDDLEITEDDLTLGESRTVERLTGTTWGSMNPAASGSECLSIIAAVLHHRHGKELKFTRDGPAGEAFDLASALPAAEAASRISSYEVERAPKS